MELISELPKPVRAYREIGGVIDFSFFREATDGEEDLSIALEGHFNALADLGSFVLTFDRDEIPSLPRRSATPREFLGQWYDPGRDMLVKRGSWTFKSGRSLEDPVIADIDGEIVDHGGYNPPDIGEAAEFAHAFLQPPHGLRAGYGEIGALFSRVKYQLLPDREPCTILDWTSARLGKLTNYFDDGFEWWGVLLCTIFHPSLRRLSVISASTTD